MKLQKKDWIIFGSIFFVILLILLWLWYSKKQAVIQQNKVVNDPRIMASSDKDKFFSIQIPSDYFVPQDIRGFQWVLLGDKSLVESQDYYKTWRQMLFWEWNNADVSLLQQCVVQSTGALNIPNNSFFSEICHGKNKYNTEEKTNFAHIKNQMKLLMQAKNNEKFSCWEFFSYEFDFPIAKRGESWNSQLNALEMDIFSCKMIKDPKFDVKTTYFHYDKAVDFYKCLYIEDTDVKKLCEIAIETEKKLAEKSLKK